VRLTDGERARAYLPARSFSHARRIADAINDATAELGVAAVAASRSISARA
jgi:hypothetical protein